MNCIKRVLLGLFFELKKLLLRLLWFCICFGLKLLELNFSEGLDPKICYVKQRTKRKTHEGRGLTFIRRGLFFHPYFLIFLHSPCWGQLHVFNIKATLVATQGAKEGVHHKELPMGIIELHWKNLHFLQTSKVWLILEV